MEALKKSASPDLFALFDLEEGRDLPCASAPVLLDYLASEGARGAKVSNVSVARGEAAVIVLGPKTDDGEALRARYRMRREEARALPAESRRLMCARLAGLGVSEEALSRLCVALGIP